MTSHAPSQDGIYDGDESDLALYKRMLAISCSAIISLDANFRILSASPSLKQLLDYDVASLIGKLYPDLIPADFRAPFHKLLEKETLTQLDYPLETAHGDWFWVHHSGERLLDGESKRYNFIVQDINQYKRPHTSAEQQRNILQSIMDNLPVAVHAVDTEGKFIYSNRAYANLLHKARPADLLGLGYEDVLDEALTKRYQAQDHEVLATGQRILHEEAFNHQNGTEQWLNVTKIPMHNTQGLITGVIGIARNVTQEKEAQERLQVSEARHRALLDALPDMMFVLRRDGTITEFRSTPEVASLGINASVVGKNIIDANFPSALIDEAALYLDIALDSQYVQSFDFIQETADEFGEHYEARIIRLNDDEVMALVRNVTSIKRIQFELSRHIEDLTIVRQVNVELSANLNVNYVAQLALDAALRLSNAHAGYLVMVQPSGALLLMSLFGQYDLAELNLCLSEQKGIIPRVIQKGKPELIFDVTKDEDYIPLLPNTEAMMIIPLNSNERIVGVLVLETRKAERFTHERFQFLQLITGRIAAFLDNAMLHRQTQEQFDEVRYLNQLKTDMIRIASHDLKNPLAGIMGYLEMLRMDVNDKLTEKERSYMDKIEVAAKKMQRITTGILSLERIQQLSEQQSREVVNLRELVNRSVSEHMDFAVRSEQKLHRHLPEDAVPIQADPLQMHEAIANLVHNAIKYTPKHGTVDVSLEVDGNIAKVRVKDTGYGIPEELQDRLFSPFYRAKTSETRFIEGTGLGLHLVKNIIERHDGEMIFESIYGEGSTFGFDMPVSAFSLDDTEPDGDMLIY